jgi:CheY-like chemotaxis protein
MDAGACQTVVLHVDDDATSRAFVRQVLALRDGVTLVEAASGNEGLVAAREHEPTLILLDFHLPDLNGDEVLRQLRSDPSTSSIAVVFISAAARPADLADVLADGDSYLRKPFEVQALLAYVDACLARAAAKVS